MGRGGFHRGPLRLDGYLAGMALEMDAPIRTASRKKFAAPIVFAMYDVVVLPPLGTYPQKFYAARRGLLRGTCSLLVYTL